jgi:hypothetical protein
MYTWDSFLDTADQFFISYSCPPFFVPVKLFEVGHCVELYLKAALSKLSTTENAIRYSHKLKDIFNECKKLDGQFLPNYEIRVSIYESNFVNGDFSGFKESDLEHYFENQELYYISKHLFDIKYIGAKQHSVDREGTIWLMSVQNPYWIGFIKELRHYLGWPTLHHRDMIKEIIKTDELPFSANYYLQNLFD